MPKKPKVVLQDIEPINKPGTEEKKGPGKEMSRRSFLQWTALAAAGPALAKLATGSHVYAVERSQGLSGFKLEEATIADMQKAMEAGTLSAQDLVQMYLDRIKQIDRGETDLRSIIETNPEAPAIAKQLDEELRTKGSRGPLHGIPILLKDNIDTADKMNTTAGSLALEGSTPVQDATVAARLRDAGAILIGKANLSEWANFRSTRSSSGWSGRGRQGRNPYVLDRNPCGSSSGSAQATSANLVAAALATETDGSIICPASACGLVGIKPTVGLTSRAGVVPISQNQDTVGPHCRTVADAAAVLGALTGVDERDPFTEASEGKSFTDYTQFLDAEGLQGARIGVAREFMNRSEHTDAIFTLAIEVLRAQGAVTVDISEIPNQLGALPIGAAEFTVLLVDFKAGIQEYLEKNRPDAKVRNLADLIQFNLKHADVEMPYFRQELFERAQQRGSREEDPDYANALARNRAFAQSFTQFMDDNQLDAIVAPSNSPAWPTDVINGDRFVLGSTRPAAVSGFPLVTVPAGFAFEQLPVGITFMGRAFDEPTLIRLAFAFEQASKVRRPPQFLPTLRLP